MPGEREKEGRGRCREREKQTEAGVNYGCNLRFPRGKKKKEREGRKKHQVMHIRLRICDIFFPWSVSRLVYNLASLFSACVCVCARANVCACWSESIYTFIRVKSRGRWACCQAFAELDTAAACVYSSVRLQPPLCVFLCARMCACPALTWPLTVCQRDFSLLPRGDSF